MFLEDVDRGGFEAWVLRRGCRMKLEAESGAVCPRVKERQGVSVFFALTLSSTTAGSEGN